MKLIARKPCCFGGQQFYIDNEIPAELVADPAVQEKLGVLAIVNAEAVNNTVMELEGTIPISVKVESDGKNEQVMAIPAKPEEIQQVFSIMQLNTEEGAKVTADVSNENVLILLHAADSRKTIKNAAKVQAGKLFSAEKDSNESDNDNASTGTGTEGVDT